MRENPAKVYEPIAISDESTVVSVYEPEPRHETAYQTEEQLEAELLRVLGEQGYERPKIRSEKDLKENLRTKLEELNDTTFSDSEWERFFDTCIAGRNEGIPEKTHRIQEDPIQVMIRDNGDTSNIKLIDKRNIHNNRLQVINQYEVPKGDSSSPRRGARHDNRYDVTILVNGLPLIHIELKRRAVNLREAFNQIDRYQRDSFWAESGLFEYVQLFIISNGTLTKYYSNTTRVQHIKDSKGRSRTHTTSNSYEFTSWWADAKNHPIKDLIPFAKTFLAKHTILSILTRYCVFTADRKLLVMRPYQIVATERILQRIQHATTYKELGTPKAGGYIWHTTGSGKTLTSFKTAQLAAQIEGCGVERVLFVVDRKDLDYQTIREYDRFQKGAANSNTSVNVLKKQLDKGPSTGSVDYPRIIVTTIQKLSRFAAAYPNHPACKEHVAIIFDECHRSQFGQMQRDITKAFKRYHLFGFTGTPIFAENAVAGNPLVKTTEDVFGDRLHEYTIVDAINDKNVLPFRMEYNEVLSKTVPAWDELSEKEKDEYRAQSDYVQKVTRHILQHYDRKTLRAKAYSHSVVENVPEAVKRRGEEVKKSQRTVRGFNAIFATSSIGAARRYYTQFQIQQQDLPESQRLKVGIIYSFNPNEGVDDLGFDEESFDTESLSTDARQFLDDAIADYNEMFGTSYDSSSQKFENYYKDLSLRVKNRELDLVIVVDMLLTGFDATTLNTLYVDKNLRLHGLIQAFSRTNRILNSVKQYGNIVCYRDLEQNTDEALELFGDRDAKTQATIKPFNEYYDEYSKAVQRLLTEFPLEEEIIGENRQKEFVKLFGTILRLTNIMTCFDQFDTNVLLTPRDEQDYRSNYLEIYTQFKERENAEKRISETDGDVVEDVLFEIELIKQVEVNVDYILMLVERSRKMNTEAEVANVRDEIEREVSASPSLRDKKDLIMEFVNNVGQDGDVSQQWHEYVLVKREEELDDIIRSERLKSDSTHHFMENAYRDGTLQTTGPAINSLLPAVSRFSPSGEHGENKRRVTRKLAAHFERFKALAVREEE